MFQTNFQIAKIKTFLSFKALFIVFFCIDFIKSFKKEHNSLGLLYQGAYETERNIESILLRRLDEPNNMNLNFYLHKIIEKKRDILTRYFVAEDDLSDFTSKIKCLWVDTESYLIYNFYSLDKLMNNKYFSI